MDASAMVAVTGFQPSGKNGRTVSKAHHFVNAFYIQSTSFQ